MRATFVLLQSFFIPGMAAETKIYFILINIVIVVFTENKSDFITDFLSAVLLLLRWVQGYRHRLGPLRHFNEFK